MYLLNDCSVKMQLMLMMIDSMVDDEDHYIHAGMHPKLSIRDAVNGPLIIPHGTSASQS